VIKRNCLKCNKVVHFPNNYKKRGKFCNRVCWVEYKASLSQKRFEKSFVISSDGCWEWQKWVGKNSSMLFKVKGKRHSAKRFSYELYKEKIPDGLLVRQQCKNYKCVNPTHLILSKQAEWHIGKKLSEEHRRKITERSVFKKGEGNPNYKRNFSKEEREKMSLAHIGIRQTEETKKKISLAHKGKKHSWASRGMLGKKHTEEFKRKMSLARRGEKSPGWRGGKMKDYPKLVRLRKSRRYNLWRKSVFERDKYACVWCGKKKSGGLEADHIKRFADYPELRFDINNGRTLCIPCHRKTDTWGNKKQKYE